jgi:hypothetical protein
MPTVGRRSIKARSTHHGLATRIGTRKLRALGLTTVTLVLSAALVAFGAGTAVATSPSGRLSIFAGTGSLGPPSPGKATNSDLNYPTGVAVDSAGNVHIADAGHGLIEKVTTQSVAPPPPPVTSSH